MRKVLVYDADPRRMTKLCEAVRAEGAEPVPAAADSAARLARAVQVAVAAGDDGIEVLARLALDRPSLPRLALLSPGLGEGALYTVIERVHPWAVVHDLSRLGPPLRDALAATHEEGDGHTTQLTMRVQRPPPAPPRDFHALVCDPLTGADNYHYLRLRLDEELDRAARYSRPVSLVLMDVDDLRGINDRHGREIGDLALRHVAATLIAGARAVDRVGRWAGGTFALLLPETAAGAAFGLAERLRADVAARRFVSSAGSETPSLPPRLRLTVSCGVASTIRDGAARAATLVVRTDGALHRAKQTGRNRSVVDG